MSKELFEVMKYLLKGVFQNKQSEESHKNRWKTPVIESFYSNAESPDLSCTTKRNSLQKFSCEQFIRTAILMKTSRLLIQKKDAKETSEDLAPPEVDQNCVILIDLLVGSWWIPEKEIRMI